MNHPDWSYLTPRERLGFILHRYGFLIALSLLFFGSLGLLLAFPDQEPQEEVDVEALVAEMERQQRASPTARPVDRPMTTLDLSSEPEGAVILLDGDSIGTTPASTRVEQGVYVLEAAADGHASVDTVIIADARRHDVFFELDPTTPRELTRSTAAPERPPQRQPEASSPAPSEQATREPVSPAEPVGTVTVTSHPTDARVFVGGEPLGTTPITTDLPVGSHEVSVRMDGFDPHVASVQVDPSQTRYVHGQLERSYGNVSVLIRPWGSIYIDGEIHALNTDVVYTTTLTVGHHVVKASHPTLGTQERSVSIERGETARVVIDMSEPPTAESDETDDSSD